MITPENVRQRWTRNMRSNSVLETVGELSLFHNAAKGRPCFLVGAGPSLIGSLRDLRLGLAMLQKLNPVVLCVDRAYPVLRGAGIVPNVVSCIDYQPEVMDFFEGFDTGETLMIANTTCWPGAAAKFRRRVFYRTPRGVPGSDDRSLEGENEAWPTCCKIMASCGHVGGEALIMADFIGCSPIMLVGYDLHPGVTMARLSSWMEKTCIPAIKYCNPGIGIINCTPQSALKNGCDIETIKGACAHLAAA